jgi:hypothetical protein
VAICQAISRFEQDYMSLIQTVRIAASRSSQMVGGRL